MLDSILIGGRTIVMEAVSLPRIGMNSGIFLSAGW
jgi:hypothetical protein